MEDADEFALYGIPPRKNGLDDPRLSEIDALYELRAHVTLEASRAGYRGFSITELCVWVSDAFGKARAALSQKPEVGI